MVPLRTFQGCRDRLARVDSHRKAFANLWADFVKNDPYSVSLQMENNGAGRLLILPTHNPLPAVFSLELGEILYHLRAILDASVYASAVQQSGQDPPPDEEHLEFPICASYDDFKKAGWKIRPLSDERRRIIEAVQPYNAPENVPLDVMVYNVNRTLGILNDWARKDRHRNLRVVGAWVANADPTFRLPSGCRMAFLGITYDGFLEDEHVVAEFNIEGFRPSMDIYANPNLTIDIAVDEPPEPCADTDRLGQRINNMIFSVRTIIDALEGSFNHVD